LAQGYVHVHPGRPDSSFDGYSLSATPEDLFARLAELAIQIETHHHPAVFTVDESAPVKAAIPGAHSKNLFLKDRKGRLFLVVALDRTRIDLKRLHSTIGADGRLSFGSAELLRAVLGVEPGSVTPFATINDTEGRVTVILDAALMRHPVVNFHPLRNTMTSGISRDDLVTFLRATGHEPQILALPAPPAEICVTAPANPL
jgi:Ala-tRNA(Pro) deacylase